MSAADATPMLLSVREIRMIVERILLHAGLPQGLIPDVRDAVLYSHAQGLGGLPMFKRAFLAAGIGAPAPMTAEGGTLDAAGNHAWTVAPSAIDLALAAFRNGEGPLTVTRLREAGEMRLLAGFAARYGAAADVSVESGSAARIRINSEGIARDTVFEAALAAGLPVPRALWHDLYAFSHKALAKDSVESRRHAGPVMVDAQGRVHGRDDDDSDLAFLFPGGKAKNVQEQA
ncbi:MAG: hypothetical protein AB7K35_08070 [Pseudorhodoplanes sp.]